MKTVKQTATVLELEIEEGAHLFAKIGLIFMSVVMGIIAIPTMTIIMHTLFSGAREINLHCYQSQLEQVNCQVKKSGLLREWSQEIEDVNGTEFALASARPRGSGNPSLHNSHTLILLTDNGGRLASVSRVFRKKSETYQSSELYRFRDKLEASLSDQSILPMEIGFKYGSSIADSLLLRTFVISLFLLMPAMLSIWVRFPVKVVLDKWQSRFCVSSHNALSLRYKFKGNLSEIERVIQRGSFVELQLSSGKNIVIATFSDSEDVRKAQLVKQINYFLGQN